MLDLIGKIVNIRDNKSLLVSLLHCLYEAQDSSLCQFVTEQLGNVLDFKSKSLTSVDSIAIGYFISSISVGTSSTKEFRVNLNNCSLGDAGTKSLMQSICSSIDPHSTVNTHLCMALERNGIHEEGASHIAELLNSTSVVNSLLLNRNPIGDKGLQAIFSALKQNKTLKKFRVTGCGMTDTGVASLADALHTNNTLETLFINGSGAITENGLTCLVEAVSRHSGLEELCTCIPKHLGVDKVRKTINEARKRNGLPDIYVWSY
jgi:Ran GTPase-activating protein (RanGAP) involved in mRNA processing and transport